MRTKEVYCTIKDWDNVEIKDGEERQGMSVSAMAATQSIKKPLGTWLYLMILGIAVLVLLSRIPELALFTPLGILAWSIYCADRFWR